MKPPLKILLLLRSLNYGGAERQLATLVEHLNPQEVAATVLVFYDGGPLAEELLAGGHRVISLHKKGRWDMALFAFRLVRAARRLRPDIIYSFMDLPNLCALAVSRLINCRLVWGVRVAKLDLHKRDWLIRSGFRLAAYFSRQPALIICNSFAGRDFHLQHGYPAAKTTVIPNGIDTARFTISRAAGQLQRKSWGISVDEHLFGLVGRLDPLKDHALFLRAAAQIRTQQPQARFVCIGDGPAEYLGHLQKLAQDLGLSDKLVWEKGRGEMGAIYNALDVLVQASAGEGFPNVVAEAMACGVPCVVTDVGDAARIVSHWGLVVPPQDEAALALAMQQILQTLPDPLLLRAHISNHYSAVSLARQTTTTLYQLLQT